MDSERMGKTQSQRKVPHGLLRALKRTRAPLTAFGMTIRL